MQCTAPLIRAELNTMYLNKQGGLSYKTQFLDRIKWDNGEYNDKIGVGNLYRRIHPVACGQCISCHLNYSRDKATQMMLETSMYPEEEVWFCTWTYNDEHLPHYSTKYLLPNSNEWKKVTGISLDKRNMQLLNKRKRWHYRQYNPHSVYCGEYGSKTNRPHAHSIEWGLPLNLARLEKFSVNEWGDPIWRCKELEEIWVDEDGNPLGNVMVGRVTWETCGYVARYTLKKALGKTKEDYKKWYQMQGKRPEYIVWSNGIGKEYFEQYKDKIYQTDSVPIVNKKTGQVVKPPKYYDRIIEKIDPELHKTITEKRQKQAENLNILSRMSDVFSPEERRAISEARMQSIMQDFRQEV